VTEQDWLNRDNPKQLIKLMADRRAGERKFLLFAAACCRRVWGHLDERSHRAVEMLESHADGDEVDLATARKLTEEALRSPSAGYGPFAPRAALKRGKPHVRAQEASVWAARLPAIRVSASGVNGDQKTFDGERRAQCELFRDSFGNPFRTASVDPSWLTSTVRSLAAEAYDQRQLPEGTFAPDRLAVLADALEEAGCSDRAILDHLRGPGPHVRGCWPLDLLLGKE
jgi:hypothetical protein